MVEVDIVVASISVVDGSDCCRLYDLVDVIVNELTLSIIDSKQTNESNIVIFFELYTQN